MREIKSSKKNQGRPSLSPIEKQRRLVARLFEHSSELELQLAEESGHEIADKIEQTLLLSTYKQRLAFAREAAQHEHAGRTAEAKLVRQKLNLFRPLGLTEEAWNALPESYRRLAPGKPKMPKELELARVEIERNDELGKLHTLESEFGGEQSDIEALRAMHGNTQVGRPAKDLLGTLDRQLHTAFYKRRDLLHRDEETRTPAMGRPRKSYEERYAYFTSIVEHCRSQIEQEEGKLPLVPLQLRYIKRLRDRATRLRLEIKKIKPPLGQNFEALKQNLFVVEDQLKAEAHLLSEFQDNYITMSSRQIESLRNSVSQKIHIVDSLDFSDEKNQESHHK